MTDSVFAVQPAPTSAHQYSLDVPVESITLPSKGLAYDAGHPLFNESSVELRCMTAREEDLLGSEALLKNGTVFDKLIEACLMNKTVDPSTLLLGDRNAILIAIRISGYGPEYSVKLRCDKCKKECQHDLSLKGLHIKPLGAAPVRENTNLFSYTLPLSKATVEFRLATGKDADDLLKTQKALAKLGRQIDNTVTLRLKQQIVSVNGNTSDEVIAKFVDSMRAGDSRALRLYEDKIKPDVNTTRTVQCPSCGDESEVNVPFGLSFFWPDIE